MNPWLEIPLADYEGHMTSIEVQQLGVLSELFAEAIAFRQPASIAILGIAGGNWLNRIDSKMTCRVVGLDVNPLYLDAVRSRFPICQGWSFTASILLNRLSNYSRWNWSILLWFLSTPEPAFV